MKWLVGPRRIGKTQAIFRLILNAKKHCVFVTVTHQVARYALDDFVRYAKENGFEVTSNKNENRVAVFPEVDKKVKPFAVTFVSFHFSLVPELRDLPKYVDNLDMILHQMVGNVIYASGTGPNIAWAHKLNENYLESVKQNLAQDQFEESFTMEWKL